MAIECRLSVPVERYNPETGMEVEEDEEGSGRPTHHTSIASALRAIGTAAGIAVDTALLRTVTVKLSDLPAASGGTSEQTAPFRKTSFSVPKLDAPQQTKTYTFPDETTLRRCLAEHPLLGDPYSKEKVTPAVSEHAARHFRDSTHTQTTLRMGSIRVVAELKGSAERGTPERLPVPERVLPMVAFALEKALTDCRKQEKPPLQRLYEFVSSLGTQTSKEK